MSGVQFASAKREMYWELREEPEQRQLRAVRLRLTYALVDPQGWDARRLGDLDVRAAWRLTR